ncbi:MAG: BTAD domain-containing putative transcriptional regulator [Anaerolineales bacterium]
MTVEYRDRMDTLAATAAEAVEEKTHNRRVIVLYPRHRQHLSLIALLQKYYGERMYFYALNEEDIDLRALMRNLSHDAMFPIGFGENTRAELRNSDDPADWARGFAQDIAQLEFNERVMILLDNFDVLPRDDEGNKALFTSFAQHLPEHIQIVVNGKELRRQLWADLINKEAVVALGDDETLGQGIFKEPALRGQLEVYALAGGSRVLIDGRPITAWEGSLPRNLFYFFIDKPMVTRSEVFEAFWPDLGIKEATNVFHVTKRKISEKLGYDLTSYENGFYVPNPRLDRLYDVAMFDSYIDAAMKANDDATAEENWYQAVEIYRGQFLKEVNMEWANQRRQELRELYAQALIGLARTYRHQGNKDDALAYFIRATGEKPDREDVHREIMQLYADQGRRDEVEYQYRFLEQVLSERLGIEPSQETREMYERLVK